MTRYLHNEIGETNQSSVCHPGETAFNPMGGGCLMGRLTTRLAQGENDHCRPATPVSQALNEAVMAYLCALDCWCFSVFCCRWPNA